MYRFGAKTMGASMAQSRLKTIEKLETSGIEAPKVRCCERLRFCSRKYFNMNLTFTFCS